MPFIQTAPHILDPNHWDLELLDAALPVTAQVIHTAGDYKRALEKIKAGQKIHCSSLLTLVGLLHTLVSLLFILSIINHEAQFTCYCSEK